MPPTSDDVSIRSRVVARVDVLSRGLVVELAGHGTHSSQRNARAQRHTELTLRGAGFSHSHTRTSRSSELDGCALEPSTEHVDLKGNIRRGGAANGDQSDKTGGRGEARAQAGTQGVLDHLDNGCARPHRVRDHRADPRQVRRAVRCVGPHGRPVVRLVFARPTDLRAVAGKVVRSHRAQAGHRHFALGTAVGSFVTGAAGALWVLFAGRIIDGASGGSLSVAQAAVADIAPEDQRPGLIGMLGAAFGIGFVLGPAIGGLAALGAHVPFYVAGVLASINAVAAMIRLPETRRPTERALAPVASRRRHRPSCAAWRSSGSSPWLHSPHSRRRSRCSRIVASD